jgi:hypothetical protein
MIKMGANAIEEKMASLMNLEQEWRDEEDEDYREDLSDDELEEELKSLPAGLSEIQERFIESLKEEVAQGGPLEVVPQAVERGPQMLPVRNQCTDIPGHVTCFKELNGLIHGGIIKAPTYSLTCRAFRLVYMYRYHGSHKKKRDEIREAVVAGVCEQKDSSGRIINTWSTASGLPLNYVDKNYYSSTSISLPPSAIWMTLEKKSDHGRWKRAWFGYYFPPDWGIISSPDKGRPIYEHWGSLGGNYIWDKHPPGAAAVESPFYNQQFSCSEGYVICTPYIKVFHPDPNMKEVIVHMMGAYRHQSQRRTDLRFYGRDAQWYCKTFK